jgi:hypothetical protein
MQAVMIVPRLPSKCSLPNFGRFSSAFSLHDDYVEPVRNHMIAAFGFAFEQLFGLHSAQSGLREPFVISSRALWSLGHRSSDRRGAG